MKILRKGDEFKKMPDGSMVDISKIDVLISQGWNYCAKKDFKEFFRGQKVEKNEYSEDSDKLTKSGKRKSKK